MVRATLAPSEFVARELEAVGVERVVRVGLGVDLDRFHPRRREGAAETRRRHGLPDGPLAMYVGRLAGEKEVDLLLSAWPEVERRTGANLVLVGDGPARRRLQRRSGSDRLHWIPFQQDRDRRGRSARCGGPRDRPLLESRRSGCPRSRPWRAVPHSSPPIAVAVAETVQRSAAGATFASGDAGALAEAAERLLTGDLRALGAAGRRYAEADHGWDAVLDRIFDVYRGILRT